MPLMIMENLHMRVLQVEDQETWPEDGGKAGKLCNRSGKGREASAGA